MMPALTRRICEAAFLCFFALCPLVYVAILYKLTDLSPPAAALLALASAPVALAGIALIDRTRGPDWRVLAIESPARLAVAVVLIGLLLRLAWIAAYPVEQYSDAQDYWDLAVRLVEAGTYAEPQGDGSFLYAWRPPGLPLLLSVPIALFGLEPWIVPVTNLCVFVLTCYVIYRTASLLVGASSAFWAVALFSFYPNQIAITQLALTEHLSILLLTAGFWTLLLSSRGKARHAVATGLLLGYGTLVRPTFVLLAPVMMVFLFLAIGDGRERLKQCALIAVAFFAVLSPWIVRNYLMFHEFVPLTTMGGENFYRANNPMAHTGLDATEKDLRALVQDELERSSVGYRWGLAWIAEDPAGFARYAAIKFINVAGNAAESFYHVMVQRHGRDGALYRALIVLGNLWWAMLWFLAAFAVYKHRAVFTTNPLGASLLVLAMYLFVIHSVFQGVARYHMPMVGLLILLALMASAERIGLLAGGAPAVAPPRADAAGGRQETALGGGRPR